MKATLESKENNRAVLSVEVDEERMNQALENAYRQVVRRLNIPGFRKGKAPRRIVERYVGKGSLLQQAAEDLLPEAYASAVDETGIEPVARPEIEIVSLEEGKAFQFKASVDVKPEVRLGDYRSIKAERDAVEVKPEQVEEELEALRRASGQLAVSEAPAKNGDFVLIDFKGYLDGEPIAGGEAKEYLLELGSGTFVGDFEKQLEGMSAGDRRRIKVAFPEDYGAEELAGKDVEFDVTVSEVKRRVLPELDDAFAEQHDAKTLDELKQKIEERLLAQGRREAEQKLEKELLDALAALVEVDIPESMIEHQIDHKIADMQSELRRRNVSWEEYLEHLGETEQQVREGLREAAAIDIRTQLALEALAEAESITVEEDEVDAEVAVGAAMYGEMAETIRNYLNSEESRSRIRGGILQRKTLARLKELTTGWSGETTGAGGGPAASGQDAAAAQAEKAAVSKEAAEEDDGNGAADAS